MVIPTKLLCTLWFAHNSTLTFDNAGGELHDNSLDSVGAGPSAWREKLHAYSTTFHHVALLDAWLHHPHKGRCKRKVIGEAQVQ